MFTVGGRYRDNDPAKSALETVTSNCVVRHPDYFENADKTVTDDVGLFRLNPTTDAQKSAIVGAGIMGIMRGVPSGTSAAGTLIAVGVGKANAVPREPGKFPAWPPPPGTDFVGDKRWMDATVNAYDNTLHTFIFDSPGAVPPADAIPANPCRHLCPGDSGGPSIFAGLIGGVHSTAFPAAGYSVPPGDPKYLCDGKVLANSDANITRPDLYRFIDHFTRKGFAWDRLRVTTNPTIVDGFESNPDGALAAGWSVVNTTHPRLGSVTSSGLSYYDTGGLPGASTDGQRGQGVVSIDKGTSVLAKTFTVHTSAAATGEITVDSQWNSLGLYSDVGYSFPGSGGTHWLGLAEAAEGNLDAFGMRTLTISGLPANSDVPLTVYLLSSTIGEAAYWTGAASGGAPGDPNNDWGYGPGLASPKSNWSIAASGLADTLHVPDATVDVIFAATNAVGVGGVLTTRMDAAYAVRSLVVDVPAGQGITSAVIDTNARALTVNGGGISVAATSKASATIGGSGSVVLGTSQMWANDSDTRSLTVNTGVTALSGETTLSFYGVGAGGVTLNGAVGNGGGTLSVLVNQAGVTRLNAANTYTGSTVVFGGTLSVGGSIAASSGVSVYGGGTFEAGASQAVKALGVFDGGVARVADGAGVRVLTVGDDAHTYATPETSGLRTEDTGRVDLVSNALVVDYAPGSGANALAAVRAKVIAGYNGGDWAGGGIGSSAAAASAASRGVGYALASEVVGAGGGTFLGVAVDGDAVVARFTLLGDATLDGDVDFDDLVRLAQNYNVTDGSRAWFFGDFTYDGDADFDDLVKLAQNYNTALPAGPVPGAPDGFAGDLARAFAAVPEPGAAGLVGAAVAVVYGLRGRRSGGG